MISAPCLFLLPAACGSARSGKCIERDGHDGRASPPVQSDGGSCDRGKVIKIDETLWAELSAEGDRKADIAIRDEVQATGYREGDAVRLVREYRSQLRIKRIGKVSEATPRYRRPRSE